MILIVMDNLVKGRKHLGVPAAAESALEHGQLQPLSIAVHKSVDGAPTLWVGDIVSHEVHVLVHRISPCGEARDIRNVAQ